MAQSETARDSIHFDLVTPARLFYEGQIQYAQIPLHDGLMGILPGHSPLVALLGFGLCTVRIDGQAKEFVIDGGFVEVQPGRLTMLANHAEELKDVDLEQAKQNLADALKEQPVGDVAIQACSDRIAAARTRIKYATA